MGCNICCEHFGEMWFPIEVVDVVSVVQVDNVMVKIYELLRQALSNLLNFKLNFYSLYSYAIFYFKKAPWVKISMRM